MKPETRERIQSDTEQLISTKCGEMTPKALNMLDKAIRDGDEEPKVKVTMTVEISKEEGDFVINVGEGKAERKLVEKGESLGVTFNPDQPELFGGGDDE